MPTSTILFPETASPYPSVGGYSSEPQPGVLAVIELDNGAEQVRARRSDLYQFRYRTIVIGIAATMEMNTFIEQCGVGDENFTFYEPYALKYAELDVGLTDGTSDLIVPYRRLGGYTSMLVDGSPVDFAVNQEFVTPTKEDQIDWTTVDPPAGQHIVFFGVTTRKRYICRMQSWRRYPYSGGDAIAESMHPDDAAVPVFGMVYELQFKEKG